MPTDFPPWMLWTAAILVVVAGAVLIGSAVRNRRKRIDIPTITFQPLPRGSSGSLAGSAKGPALAPPAPLAASAPTDGPEQRVDFRRPGNPVVVLIADADDQRTPWNAWVVDRSRRGLRLAVERPLSVGKTYTVRPAQAPPTTPWSAFEVRHCIPVDKHWEAGCRFVKPPSVAVLMLFG